MKLRYKLCISIHNTTTNTLWCYIRMRSFYKFHAYAHSYPHTYVCSATVMCTFFKLSYIDSSTLIYTHNISYLHTCSWIYFLFLHTHVRYTPYRPLNSEDCVYVDKFKMDQVIRNLISNALKFTPKGGSISVTVSKLGWVELIELSWLSWLDWVNLIE